MDQYRLELGEKVIIKCCHGVIGLIQYFKSLCVGSDIPHKQRRADFPERLDMLLQQNGADDDKHHRAGLQRQPLLSKGAEQVANKGIGLTLNDAPKVLHEWRFQLEEDGVDLRLIQHQSLAFALQGGK